MGGTLKQVQVLVQVNYFDATKLIQTAKVIDNSVNYKKIRILNVLLYIIKPIYILFLARKYSYYLLFKKWYGSCCVIEPVSISANKELLLLL